MNASDGVRDRQPRPAPDAAARRDPQPAHALALFAAILILHSVVGYFTKSLMVGLVVGHIVLVLGVTLLLAVLTRLNLRRTFFWRLPPAGTLSLTIVAVAAGLPLLTQLTLWLVRTGLFDVSQLVETEEHFEALLTGRPFWMHLLLLAAIPMLCEELPFRGLILRGLLQRGSPALGIFVSALLFGAIHVVPLRAIPVALLGALLAYVVWRTGSILPAIIGHGVHNSLVLWMNQYGAVFELDWVGDWSEAASGTEAGVPAVVLLGCAGVLAASLAALQALTRRGRSGFLP